MIATKERPILFSTEMVKAILDGRKTQTRRVIKPQPFYEEWKYYLQGKYTDLDTEVFNDECLSSYGKHKHCPYGQIGDRLWVREQHHICCVGLEHRVEHRLYYQGGEYKVITSEQAHTTKNWASNRPSIHMPRWASRITLEITDIRVERLQDISEGDAKAEGCYGTGVKGDISNLPLYSMVFRNLWDSINAKRGYSWDFNPWVWVISFKVTNEAP